MASSKTNITCSKKFAKNKCVYFNEIIWLIIMKMRIKMIRILHKYNTNRTRSRDENKCNEYEICFSAIMVICNKQDLSSTEA